MEPPSWVSDTSATTLHHRLSPTPLYTHTIQHHHDVAHPGPYLDGTPALPLRLKSSAQVSLISNLLFVDTREPDHPKQTFGTNFKMKI